MCENCLLWKEIILWSIYLFGCFYSVKAFQQICQQWNTTRERNTHVGNWIKISNKNDCGYFILLCCYHKDEWMEGCSIYSWNIEFNWFGFLKYVFFNSLLPVYFKGISGIKEIVTGWLSAVVGISIDAVCVAQSLVLLQLILWHAWNFQEYVWTFCIYGSGIL